MKQKINNMRKTLLLLLLAVTLLIPNHAKAAVYSCEVNIPVEVKLAGSNAPTGVEYQIVMETMDAANPMPEQSVLTITDAGTVQFGPITYTRPGDYRYRIYLNADPRAYFTYDETVYNVNVRVLNDEQTGGLCAEIWATKDQEAEKVYELLFTNRYDKPYTPPASDPEPEVPEVVPEIAEETPLVGVLGAILPQGVLGANRVKTGDSAPVAMLLAVVAAAVAAIFIVLSKKHKKAPEE